MESKALAKLWVDRNYRGGWEVSLADRRLCIVCETLDDPRRQAHLYAARRKPCELVVRDAYHRVIDHEIIAQAAAPAERGALR